MVLGIIIALVSLAAVVWVIVDVFTKQQSMSTTNKVIWTICALLFGIITAIVYYFVVKNK